MVLAAIAFLVGASFVVMLLAYNGESVVVPVTQLFYSTMFYWVIVLISIPIITMRLLAQEHQSKTIETLMTCPVGEWSVVLAKFCAGWLYYLASWIVLIPCVIYVHKITLGSEPVDWILLMTTFFGIALMGSAYTAVGLFGSSLTHHQITAATISFGICIALFSVSFLKYSVGRKGGWIADLTEYVCQIDHMADFVRGIVDSRAVVYYLVLTILFLFMAVRVLESRRWR